MHRRIQRALVWCLPLLLLALVRIPSLGMFFVADDFIMLHSAATAPSGWEAFQLRTPWDEDHLRPLGVWTWWVQHELFGLRTWPPRLFGLILHASIGLVLARLVLRCVGDRRSAFATALVFAVHPVHTETLVWCCVRFDLLFTLGTMGALLYWSEAPGQEPPLVRCRGNS